MVLLAACGDGKTYSICDVDGLPVDQSYEFKHVAVYSDGHTTLAFDHDDPRCEPVAFDVSSSEDISPIWKITSQSTADSTIGAVGNITAKIEQFGPRGVRLKLVRADKWGTSNINAQLEALHAQAPKSSDPYLGRAHV